MRSEATVLFSGGTDSTLAAARILEDHKKVTLLTFNPSFLFFIGNSRKHAQKLMETCGTHRVSHIIIDIREVFEVIFTRNFWHDIKKYGPGMVVQLCHGCRLAMYTQSIIYNLEHGIKYIADGSIRKQSTTPEQMECVIESNRKFYKEKFGIIHFSPIYEEDKSDVKLSKLGIALKDNLKRQFIFFDTQPTCPFGVPADVYGKIFYRKLFCDPVTESLDYNREKHTIMSRYIKEYFDSKKIDMKELITRINMIDS